MLLSRLARLGLQGLRRRQAWEHHQHPWKPLTHEKHAVWYQSQNFATVDFLVHPIDLADLPDGRDRCWRSYCFRYFWHRPSGFSSVSRVQAGSLAGRRRPWSVPNPRPRQRYWVVAGYSFGISHCCELECEGQFLVTWAWSSSHEHLPQKRPRTRRYGPFSASLSCPCHNCCFSGRRVNRQTGH